MKPRTSPQNRLFHVLVRDVARVHPLVPFRRPVVLEAWKRRFIAAYVREARLEAYCAGRPNPFPDGPAQSSKLDSWQMDELIECTYAFAAQQLGLILDREAQPPVESAR